MDLYTLDSKFQPNDIVENYESLIWSERYFKNGDFQLTSGDIAATIAALPLESVVSLRDSLTPMVVEVYKIKKSATGAPELVVTGRSYEACALERRLSVKSLPTSSPRDAWTLGSKTPSDAAYRAIRTVIGDVARTQGGVQVLPSTAPAISPLDALPEIDLVLPRDFSIDTPNTYEIKAAELYATVMELIVTNNHGLKATRPTPAGSKIGVEIYNGADLTNTVVFDARFDQFDGAEYLLSNQGSADVAYVYGPNGSQKVLKTSAPEPTGMARRLLLVDDLGDATANTSTIRGNRGLIELYKKNATALFDGEVSVQIASGFNNTYYLGDIVKLVGEYGLSQNVRVAEFIRTSDAQGEKAYPTLEAVNT